MVAYAYNPNTLELRQRDYQEFKASLGYKIKTKYRVLAVQVQAAVVPNKWIQKH